MKTVLLGLIVLASSMSHAADVNEWGPTVDGLRMSTAVVPDGHGDVRVRVTIHYAGDKPLLLPFAFISGDRVLGHRLRLFFSATDGQHTFDLVPFFLLSGRFDPLVIPMVPEASYALELPIAAWHTALLDEEQLGTLIQHQGQLWAELDGKPRQTTLTPSVTCPLYGYPNPNQIVCWEGKLTSNRLQFPR